MESYQLAKANIKILNVYEGERVLWVRFSYQWRDKHRQPQWAEDMLSVPKIKSEYNAVIQDTLKRTVGIMDVRKEVYDTVQDARAKLEARED